jgi:opacity protein-like surface antigen
MRKLIIVIAITLMAASSANAQFYKDFGIKAGTSIANQTFTYSDMRDYSSNYKFGFTAGIFKEFQIIQNLKSQVGINYSRKGSLIEVIETDEFGNLTGNKGYVHDNFDFITAELYGKYNFLKSKINPYILAGLRIDFYLSQHIFYRDSKGNESEDEIGIPVTNNKIFGASLGAGVDYQVSKQFSLFLEGTYNPDFTDIYNGGSTIRGRSFDIRTGIKF